LRDCNDCVAAKLAAAERVGKHRGMKRTPAAANATGRIATGLPRG